MAQNIQLLILIGAVVAAIFGIAARSQPGASTTTVRLTSASILLSVAMIVGTAPRVFFPSATRLHVSAYVVSAALTAVSIVAVWRAASPTA